jgi:hypothetical protein
MPRGKFIDLTDREFGRLLVVGRAEDYVSPQGQHAAQWRAECACGGSTVAMGSKLRTGKTRSCGCLGREVRAENIAPPRPRKAMSQEELARHPRDDDGWLRVPVVVTVDDGERRQAVCEYRTPAEGPVVTSGGHVIPGHRITRVQTVDAFMREQADDPRAPWPPRMPGCLPAGMHS